MRHQNKKGHLSRNNSSRKALLMIMANNLIKHQRMETTIAKAKALRSYVEPLITLAKNGHDSISARRRAFKKLCDKTSVKFLFDELAPLYKDIPGGYTRIIQSRDRKGDGAQLVIMELTKRTRTDDELLGIKEIKKEKPKKDKETTTSADGKAPAVKAKKTGAADKKKTVKKDEKASEKDSPKKEGNIVESVRKEKVRKEQKKVQQKSFFKRFRRKTID